MMKLDMHLCAGAIARAMGKAARRETYDGAMWIASRKGMRVASPSVFVSLLDEGGNAVDPRRLQSR